MRTRCKSQLVCYHFQYMLKLSRKVRQTHFLTVFYNPKPVLAEMLDRKPELAKLLWQKLNKISIETLVREGQIFGDGLHKLEPKELSKVPLDNIYTALPELLEVTESALF